MKLKSLVSGFLAVIFLCVGISTTVFAEVKESSNVGVAYSKIDLSEVGSLENIQLSKENNELSVNFTLNGKVYGFDAIRFGEDKNGVKYASKENDNGLSFNILESGDSMTGVINNKAISPINFNTEDSFGFVISKTASQQQLTQTIQEAKVENREALKLSKHNIQTTPGQNQISTQALTSPTNLHVLASGWSFPGIISSGVSEGWAYSTHKTQQFFKVTNIQYSIAYNWPSDGISLWYDYVNSSQAYHSPAWPNAGLTSVSGSWDIDATKGMFVAETFINIGIKGIPVGYTWYDTTTVGI